MIDGAILEGKIHDLGSGMEVSRILPQVGRRMVGPFAFFDHSLGEISRR